MQGFVLGNMCKSPHPLPDSTPDSILRYKIFATTVSHKVKISPSSGAQCSLLHNTPLMVPWERQLPKDMSW